MQELFDDAGADDLVDRGFHERGADGLAVARVAGPMPSDLRRWIVGLMTVPVSQRWPRSSACSTGTVGRATGERHCADDRDMETPHAGTGPRRRALFRRSATLVT